MQLSVYDPKPWANEYLSRMFLGSLRCYKKDVGPEIETLDTLDGVTGKIILIAGDHLSHERISQLKENKNKVVVFDINDSSYLSSTYFGSSLIPELDLIFKISGVPKKNITLEPAIDENFIITSKEVKYLPDEEWEKFMAIRHKIKSLPYTLWTPLVPPSYQINRPRNNKVLVGGGNHFWRVILFFKLVQQGLNDPDSQFCTSHYFAENMAPQFRYCGPCREERKAHGRTPYHQHSFRPECTSIAKWGEPEDIVGGPGSGKPQYGMWNNRCPASFFWLAQQYEKLNGPLNSSIEKALNGTFRHADDFVKSLGNASYYADYKWLNTIYAPPRFWEAASVGTVNLYPERTQDQEYWPPMESGEHYMTFPEDMDHRNGGFGINPHEHHKDWDRISRAAKDLYEGKIRGTRYAISNALLSYMLEEIEKACSVN